MFRDFKIILKNTLEWLGVFSFLAILSVFIELNLVYYMLIILLFSEIFLWFNPESMKKIDIIYNIYLDFIMGILVFGFLFFILLNSIHPEFYSIKLGIYYLIYEVIKLIREYLYLKRMFPKQYYKKD